MNILTGVCSQSMAFAASTHALADATSFTHHVLKDWDLDAYSTAVQGAASRLIAWMTAHQPATTFRLELTWDSPLLHLEVVDRATVLPDPFVSRCDARLAVDLLTPPIVEWGAQLDCRGRCLWTTLRTTEPDTSTAVTGVRRRPLPHASTVPNSSPPSPRHRGWPEPSSHTSAGPGLSPRTAATRSNS